MHLLCSLGTDRSPRPAMATLVRCRRGWCARPHRAPPAVSARCYASLRAISFSALDAGGAVSEISDASTNVYCSPENCAHGRGLAAVDFGERGASLVRVKCVCASGGAHGGCHVHSAAVGHYVSVAQSVLIVARIHAGGTTVLGWERMVRFRGPLRAGRAAISATTAPAMFKHPCSSMETYSPPHGPLAFVALGMGFAR